MKNLVNKIAILAIFLSCVSISACNKLLDKSPVDQRQSLTSASAAADLVTGVYSCLMYGNTWSNPSGGTDVHGFSFIAATNIISDDADKGSVSTDQPGIGEFDNLDIATSNVFVNALWNGYYYAIGQANNTIATLQSSSLDTATINEYTAEVRFIRGYLYFNLVRMFGDVCMVTKRPTNPSDQYTDPEYNTRTKAQIVYDSLIIPDFEFAIAHLPLKSAAQVGHATKGAAEAFLAKVYLYQKNWQQTLNLTSDIISSGQYQLLPDYSMLWRPEGNNCIESIFEIESGVYANTDFGINLYSECQGPRVGGMGGWQDLGWGFCTPTTSLINSYEPNDSIRRNATIIFIDNSGKHIGTYLWDGFRIPSSDSVQNLYYNYKAYSSELAASNPLYHGNRDQKQKNIHLMRYAEVLLMHAEAANELGQTATAQADLNQVRNRVKLSSTTAASQTDLRTAIWQERHVELALEHDRFWDLVRTGRAAAVMTAAGKPFITGKSELLPIPAAQIALSGGKLTQNPGY